MDELRKKLEEKLKSKDRSFIWFYKNYVEGKKNSPGYSTAYHQYRGFILTLSDGLISGIEQYLSEK